MTLTLLSFYQCVGCSVTSGMVEGPAIKTVKRAERGLADTRGVLQNRTKYWLQLTQRRTNDAQHIGGGRLLLQRLA